MQQRRASGTGASSSARGSVGGPVRSSRAEWTWMHVHAESVHVCGCMQKRSCAQRCEHMGLHCRYILRGVAVRMRSWRGASLGPTGPRRTRLWPTSSTRRASRCVRSRARTSRPCSMQWRRRQVMRRPLTSGCAVDGIDQGLQPVLSCAAGLRAWFCLTGTCCEDGGCAAIQRDAALSLPAAGTCIIMQEAAH